MKRYIRSATTSNVKLAVDSKDPKVLAQLANDEDEEVRMRVAEDSNTPIESLAQLANDENKFVRQRVAQNSNTPAEALAQLANDESRWVRIYVANNPSTLTDVLAQLANDEDEGVRWTVADNSNTPVDILVQLADDPESYVRWTVAKNPNTPIDVLSQLASDKDKEVRQVAKENPNCPVKSKKLKKSNKWQTFISELEKDCEEYGDPLYEQSTAGEKLLELCYDVEREMPFWLEPSVQAGQGGIWIRDNETDETLAEDIDYADFNYNVVDMAFESGSADEFKQKYKTYLLGLVE